MQSNTKTTLANVIDDSSFQLLNSLKSSLPEKITTWSKEARKLQFRENKKRFKKLGYA